MILDSWACRHQNGWHKLQTQPNITESFSNSLLIPSDWWKWLLYKFMTWPVHISSSWDVFPHRLFWSFIQSYHGDDILSTIRSTGTRMSLKLKFRWNFSQIVMIFALQLKWLISFSECPICSCFVLNMYSTRMSHISCVNRRHALAV